EPGNYVAYLEAIRKLHCVIGKDLAEHLGGRSFTTGDGDAVQLRALGPAFRMRVLDVYLMISGGRAFDIKSDRLLDSLKSYSPEFRLF
ncbi:MAG: hypothetical protein OXH76_01945, partial [Boseongicola sp.]|nr:hypothetical protein [Boseongicola sp.]